MTLITATLTVSGTVYAQTNNQNRDYLRIYNSASIAINECYDKGDLYACEKISRIKNILTQWCSQGDKTACTTYISLEADEALKQTGKIH